VTTRTVEPASGSPTELPHPGTVAGEAAPTTAPAAAREEPRPSGGELPSAEVADERPAPGSVRTTTTRRPPHKSTPAPSRAVATRGPGRALPLPPGSGTRTVGTNAPVATLVPQAPSPAVTLPSSSAPAAPAKLEGEGTLLVATSPWCRVIVDGTDRGATPLKIKLPAGPHTLLLVNPEFHINRSFPVTIQPNETVRKRLDFAD
jgi:hypothetical protein